MVTKPLTESEIHGVIDDAWARYWNNVAIDILARENSWVMTKRKLTPKAGVAVQGAERPSA